MEVQSLIAGIGYTFSLVFATQGITNTFADVSKALLSAKKIMAFIDDLEPIATESTTDIMNNLALQVRHPWPLPLFPPAFSFSAKEVNLPRISRKRPPNDCKISKYRPKT